MRVLLRGCEQAVHLNARAGVERDLPGQLSRHPGKQPAPSVKDWFGLFRAAV